METLKTIVEVRRDAVNTTSNVKVADTIMNLLNNSIALKKEELRIHNSITLNRQFYEHEITKYNSLLEELVNYQLTSYIIDEMRMSPLEYFAVEQKVKKKWEKELSNPLA